MNKNKAVLITTAILVVAFLAFAWQFIRFGSEAEDIALVGGETDFCADFSEVEKRISCQEAAGIATKEFPGEVIKVDRRLIDLSFLGEEEQECDLWLITIRLKKPFERPDEAIKNSAIVGIDTASGEVKYSELQ